MNGSELGRCRSAADVLPPKLLSEVQKHYQGLLWVPVVKRRDRRSAALAARDRRIARERRSGIGTARLAKKHGLSRERIRQILRRPRQ